MQFSFRIQSLLTIAQPFYTNEDPGHDWAHILRVLGLSQKLASDISIKPTEAPIDFDVLYAGAALHDLVNLPKDHPERLFASQMAADKAEDLLNQCAFSNSEIFKIKSVITEHSYSRGLKPSSLESAIVQDSDKLDALGAIGIMRTVTCGARMRASYYDINDPAAKNRSLDDKNFTLDHFEKKLFRLPDLMNTLPGKIEAERRIQFMKRFKKELWQDCSYYNLASEV